MRNHHVTLYVANGRNHSECRCGWASIEATIEEALKAGQLHREVNPEEEWPCDLTNYLFVSAEEFLNNRRITGASITADHDHDSEERVVIQFVISDATPPVPQPGLEFEVAE